MSTEYLTVTALTKYIKRKFDADPYLERVYVTGEISNYRKRPRHQYFSLKDDHALIQGVMYQREFSQVKFDLQEGMKVLVVGRVNVYEASGNYNIIIEHIEPDGVGALYQAYEQLKEKLYKEGLFSRPKKALPPFPKKIAVVTSESGAVIRDIMTTIKRRYPIAQIVLYPTVVQGKESAANIVKNLKEINKQDDFDVVIIGRGGGSIEDLWSFNEEKVIRQIVDMTIPVISSVGHETDTTLSDLAADVRAATPTAAAELSVPVLTDVLQDIQKQEQRLYQSLRHQIAVFNEKLNRLKHSYVFRQPSRLYEGHVVKLDQLSQRLQGITTQKIQQEKLSYQNLNQILQTVSPIHHVSDYKRDWQLLDQDLNEAINRYMDEQKRSLSQTINSLDLLSPLKIMARGYSYVTFNEKVVTSTDHVQVGNTVEVHLKDGTLQTEIKDIKETEHDRD